MSHRLRASGKGAQILQCNLRQSPLSLQTVTKYAQRNDIQILLLQDIPKQFSLTSLDYFGFQKFVHQGASAALTAILVRRGILAHEVGAHSSRTTRVLIQTQHSTFGIISAYIQYTSGDELTELSRVLFVRSITRVPVPSPFVCLTDWECSYA